MLKRFSKKELLFETAAKTIAQQITNILKRKYNISLALCGGRSAAAICEHLIKLQIPWERVHLFVVDERLVPITNDESNFKIIKEQLIDKIIIPRINVHPFIYNNTLERGGCKEYERQLQNSTEIFDIVVLSAGEDGHIGGIYPNHPLNASKNYFEVFDDSPKPPAQRMSFTPALLKKTKFAVLLFIDSPKKKALAAFQSRSAKPLQCPAKYVKTLNHIVLTNIAK
jgi:6-phosphogluconolactonase